MFPMAIIVVTHQIPELGQFDEKKVLVLLKISFDLKMTFDLGFDLIRLT